MTAIVHLDDDPRSLQLTEALLSSIPDVTYLGGFSNETAFFLHLLDVDCDLAILDIEMPERLGLDVAKRLLKLNIPFIFLTNHHHYSLEAFKLAAIDFYTKPLEIERFKELLVKLKEQRNKDRLLKNLSEKIAYLEKNQSTTGSKSLVINSANRVDFLQLDEIVYIEGESSLSHFKMFGREDTITASKTLKHFEFLLESNPDFVRVHKRVIVNRKYVSSIIKSYDKGFEVRLTDGYSFKLSSSGRALIIQQLGGSLD